MFGKLSRTIWTKPTAIRSPARKTRQTDFPMRTTAVLAVLLAAAAGAPAPADDELPPEFRRLLPLHKPLPEPRPGDWLRRHEEPGQTYAEYLASEPGRADRQRRIICSHMFSMLHCTRHLCNMCGSNHLDEADRHPLWLCPHCLAKLCRATGADPRRRFRALIGFFDKVGFDEEAAFMRKSLETMGWAE